jgi:hypothetical protein
MTPNYSVFERKCVGWRNDVVQAKQVTMPRLPVRTEPPDQECGYGFRMINQFEPYGVVLELEFEVNPRWPHLDNYFTSHGFNLYSGRLVDLMKEFGVACESFPATVRDKSGVNIEGLDYHVFHYLEQVHDCLEWRSLARSEFYSAGSIEDSR